MVFKELHIQFTNSLGCDITDYGHDIRSNTDTLFSKAQSNITNWNDFIIYNGYFLSLVPNVPFFN